MPIHEKQLHFYQCSDASLELALKKQQYLNSMKLKIILIKDGQDATLKATEPARLSEVTHRWEMYLFMAWRAHTAEIKIH